MRSEKEIRERIFRALIKKNPDKVREILAEAKTVRTMDGKLFTRAIASVVKA